MDARDFDPKCHALTNINITAVDNMLERFEIFTTTGVVLWSRNTTDAGSSAINSLINDVFIEARPTTSQAYQNDKYTLKYALVKDLGLIFVVWNISQLKNLTHTDSVTGSLPINPPLDMGRRSPRKRPDRVSSAFQGRSRAEAICQTV